MNYVLPLRAVSSLDLNLVHMEGLMKRIGRAAALPGWLCSCAFSGTVVYSVVGVFPISGTPSTTLSANGASFEYSFSLSDTPAVSSSDAGGFTVSNVPVSYKLNAIPFAAHNVGVQFVSSSGGPGGLSVLYANGPDFVLFGPLISPGGPQLYTGATSNPTLTLGSFPIIGGFALSIGGPLVSANAAVNATNAPEPATFGLAALALAAGGLVQRSRKRSSIL
jgi:hypothetical protein